METKVYSPYKKELETIDVTFASENTAWFDEGIEDGDTYTITDRQGGSVLRQLGYNHPV